MSGRVRPIALVIQGVNRATGTIRAINRDIESMLAPIRKVQNSFRLLAKEAGLNKVTSAVKNVGSKFAELGRTFLYGSVGLAALAAALARFVNSADDIGAIAAKLDLTTDAVQELRYAGELLDVETEQVDAGLKTFTKSVADMARGTGRAKFAFQALRVNVRDGKGNIRPTVDLMDEFADKLQGVRDPALRARYVLAAFGNVDFVNVLKGGSQELRRLRQEAHELGYVLDEDTIKQAAKADDELRRLKFTTKGLAYSVGADLLPEVTRIATETRLWLQENRSDLVKNLTATVKNLASVLGFVSRVLLSVMSTTTGTIAVLGTLATVIFGPALAAIAKLGGALFGLALRTGFLSFVAKLATGGLALLAKAFTLIGAAIAANPIGAIIVGVIALGAAIVLLYKYFKPFRDLVDGVWARLKANWAALLKPLGNVVSWLVSKWQPFKALIDATIAGIQKAKGWVGLGDSDEGDAADGEGRVAAARMMRRPRAFDQVPPAHRVGGSIGIRVGVERGASARVERVESTSRQVPLSTGPVMGGAGSSW